ncbi:MAG TPA: DUF5821 family protein, partial [Methanomicrobiales archaeon]|nr:DUF5821 family protein [Methanomicrobiales archaeon]
MSSEATIVDQEFTETIHSFLEDADTVLIVNPAPEVFRTVIQTATEFDDDLPELRVLATPDVLKATVEDFILASQAADLIEDGTLSLRTTIDTARSSLLIGDEQIMTVVTLDTALTGLHSTDDDFVETVRTAFMDEWDAGDEFTLRTPPLSRVRETLRDDFGEDVEDDFISMLESVETVPGEDDELNEVVIA